MSGAALVARTTPDSASRRLTIAITQRHWIAAAALCVLAVAIVARSYELRDVPRLTDETDEVMRGLAIMRGEILPLTNIDAYIGPLWNYLLALGFAIVGPTTMLPRVFTLVAALVTVGATARLARELARQTGRAERGTLIGLGAALLLATSSFHAVVSSRIGWSHSLTPLMMTLALILFCRWERTGDDRLLMLGGLAYGFAVHTHATALAVAPGLGIWALLHWRSTLARRAGWAALGLFLLANLPMIAHNAVTGFGSVSAAVQVQRAYAAGAATTLDGYFANLGTLLSSLPFLLVGEIGERRGVFRALEQPIAFAYVGLVVGGLLVALRHRIVLPLLLIVSAALVLPLANGKYEPLFNGRYLAPLLPLAFVLAALAVDALVHTLRIPMAWRTGIAALIIVAMTALPLASLGGYVRMAATDGPNTRELYRAAEIVAAAGTSKPVLVDATISGTRASTGREGTGVLEYILYLNTRLTIRRYQPDDLIAALERDDADLVLVSTRLLVRLDKGFDLEMPPGEDEARRRRRAPFAVTRVTGHADSLPDLANGGSDRANK